MKAPRTRAELEAEALRRITAESLVRDMLSYDQEHPGDRDALVEVPAKVWAYWLRLAKTVDGGQ